VNDYAHWVDPVNGTMSREIFVSESAHRDELEHLFSRAWLFVGHESLIPKPGDFFQSRMGEESVLLCRDRAGKIHVFLNTCRHRGMKVCRYDEGNTPLFTCPYHAWSYTLDGKLAGVPMADKLYEGVLDRSQWGLIEVPQMANYKGAIFATWDPLAPSFDDYLGEAKSQLDVLLDCRDGRPGGSEVIGGIQKWVVPSNWKFGTENFMGDTYHNVSHRSVDLIGISPNARSGMKGRRSDEIPGTQHVWFAYPQGHGIHSMLLPEDNWYVDAFRDSAVVEEYFRHCYEERKRRQGPEQSRWVGLVGSLFPNTSFHARQPRAMFVWHPNGPTSMEIWRFYLVDADAPAEVKDFLRHYYMRYSGPAGMTEQDDMENWNYATKASIGTIARRYPYNYQQSLHAARPGVFGAAEETLQMTEHNSRNFYAKWAQYVSGSDWNVLVGRGGETRRAVLA
jgi:phenylpropionate dioxygenase-like ring-hydroxylating dioxygenase large terminal subunit